MNLVRSILSIRGSCTCAKTRNKICCGWIRCIKLKQCKGGFKHQVQQGVGVLGEGHYGLFGLCKRLGGGDVQIDSHPGDGTVEVLTVPLTAKLGEIL